MKITCYGAARVVTGSKHLLHIHPDKSVLLDCGLFQGMGKETIGLNSHFGFDPKSLYCVIISHAHIDHVGLLPRLVKEGYSGKIYCTPQTLELAKLLMTDSAFIQESDVAHVNKIREQQGRPPEEPLYTVEDAENVFPLLEPIPMGEPFKIDDALELLYTDAGHILGAAVVNLTIKENGNTRRLAFSGDIGRYGDLILKSPAPFPQADYIMMETTYCNRLHEVVANPTDKLYEYIVDTCVRRRGRLIIPAFSVGRTQELLFLLNRLENEHRLPDLDYYVDSPLSIETTELIKHHPECFNNDVKKIMKSDPDIFGFKGLKYTKLASESIALNEVRKPCVIISASGMAEAGRVKHHILHGIEDSKNTILIVGYCEPHSLGGMLRAGADEVSIYGVRHSVKAEVGHIESLSAHGDYDDLCLWLSCQDPKKVRKMILVHGEYAGQEVFRERLIRKGFGDVSIPQLGEEVGLGD
jgi:metallo-beta-lactamase family protein